MCLQSEMVHLKKLAGLAFMRNLLVVQMHQIQSDCCDYWDRLRGRVMVVLWKRHSSFYALQSRKL